MNTRELIGERIKDIFLWSKMEVGGLDEAEVFIKLTNGKIVFIPWGFESENLETTLKNNSKSLIEKSPDKIKMDSIELSFPEGKTWKDVREELERDQKSTFIGRLLYKIGLKKEFPKEYLVCTTEYEDNELKKLQNQKIIDFLMFEDLDSFGYLELENGYIISQTIVAPHGTGMAGLKIFQNLTEFKERCCTDYKRITSYQK